MKSGRTAVSGSNRRVKMKRMEITRPVGFVMSVSLMFGGLKGKVPTSKVENNFSENSGPKRHAFACERKQACECHRNDEDTVYDLHSGLVKKNENDRKANHTGYLLRVRNLVYFFTNQRGHETPTTPYSIRREA